ncbi:MAG: rRNA adenine N-6-methyltransferase family protein [Bacteroidota bacterium]
MGSSINFFKESIKNIKTVGTITRSSKYLCKGMIRHVDFSKANNIVELGAGDGVITKHILKNMKKDSKLLAFEVHNLFAERLRNIDDPRLHAIEDSAEKLDQYLKQHDIDQVDYFISAIPFVALPDDLSYRIVRNAHERLKKGGLYVQVHYSLLTKKMYQTIFGNVDINWVPLNLPPAFVLVSQKR